MIRTDENILSPAQLRDRQLRDRKGAVVCISAKNRSLTVAAPRFAALPFAALILSMLSGAALAEAPTSAPAVNEANVIQPETGTAGAAIEPVQLSLRKMAYPTSQPVRVGDLVEVRGGDAATIKAIQEATLELGGAATAMLTHEQLLEKLSKAGVNIGHLLLSGAAMCEITLPAVEADAVGDAKFKGVRARRGGMGKKSDGVTPRQARSQEPDPLAEPMKPLGTGLTDDGRQNLDTTVETRTLAELLAERVQAEYDRYEAKAELDFEQAGHAFLELLSPPMDFVIQGGQRAKGGLREFRVALQQDGVTQRNVRIFARVRVTKAVAVAKAPLNVGNYVKRDDVELLPRTFIEGAEDGYATLEEIVGQRMKRLVDAGEMIRGGDLRSEPLVLRSRPVSVQGRSASVSVKMTGVALDNGMLGDEVRVRVGPSAGKRRELRGVVTGVGAIQLIDE